VPYLILDVQHHKARAWGLLGEVLEIPVVIQSPEID
jgi:hypothetical protein